MNNEFAALIAKETLNILERGKYTTLKGTYSIQNNVEYSNENTRFYDLSLSSKPVQKNYATTEMSITEESTLQASKRLSQYHPGVLNFASARTPGGGFLRGALAQEETIVRSSTLYASIKDHPVYEEERQKKDHLYGSWVLYTPGVLVFRGDDGVPIDDPYLVDIATCPAPNLRGLMESRTPFDSATIQYHLYHRIDLILSAFYEHGIRTLVLGAWGCGVFCNDPRIVAFYFQMLLQTKFEGAFERVVFAVYTGGRKEDPNYSAFMEVFYG
jgi:uncharacterized protein (TIGR02452 family)